MGRDIGEIQLLQEQLPEWIAAIAGVLTTLGDFWFIVLLMFAVFLVADSHRSDMIALLGTTIGAVGLYRGFKHTFTSPRPEQSPLDAEGLHALNEGILELTATSGGYGFPSGHATVTTVVYLGLASTLTVGTVRKRLAAGAAIIATVSTTRLLLGVHYLADVVAGVALGSLLVFGLFVLPRKLLPAYRVTVPLLAAIPMSLFYVAMRGGSTESLVLFGATLLLFAGWQLLAVRPSTTHFDRLARRPVLRASTALLAVGVFGSLVWEFSAVSTDPSSTAVQATVGALAILSVLAVSSFRSRQSQE